MGVCEVLCCRSSQDPRRIYHRFPNDPSRCKEWLKMLGKKSSDLKPKSVVCSRHFRFKDYYSGGKRLLPSATPVLRLSNSPKKDKPVSKVRQSEPNRPKNVNRLSPTRLRKSVPNITTNQSKEVKQSPQLLKKISKSKVALDASKSKQLVKTVPNPKNEKHQNENQLKADSSKAVVRKNLKHNQILWKPASSRLGKRSPLDVKSSLSRNRYRLLRKNNKKSPLKTKDGKNPSASMSDKKNNPISKIKKCSTNLNGQSINQQPSKLKDIEGVVKLKNSIGSDGIITLKSSDRAVNGKENQLLETTWKSPSDSTINEEENKSLEHESTAKTNVDACELESKNRRSVKKRKRLLSEEGVDCDETFKSKPKVQKYKKSSGVSKERKQTQKSICNTGSKNLSGIEETILEMQNKIQVLEKKAILDEKRIETFKKALITQRNTDLQILMDEKENELLLRMDLLYLDYEPQRICRLCLQLVDKQEDLTSLFWPLQNQALLSLIKQATNVEVELEDGMPSGICGDCLEDIRRVDWLRRRTHKSNSLIKKFVNMKKNSTQHNVETPQMANNVKLKANDFSSEAEITEVFKIEDVFSLENSPMSFENIQIKQEQESDEGSKLNNELNTTFSIAVKKPQKSRTCGNCSKSFKNSWILMIHLKYCSKRFQCSECNKCFLNAALLRRHKQTMYSCFCSENLRYCSDCNISFRWKWQLVFHVLRHSTQMCVLCGDTIHSREHLQHHFREAHADY